MAINGEYPIISQGVLDELNIHQTPWGKSKIKIIICRSNIYQIIDIEEIRSIFYQVIPVVSHLEVCLPKKPLAPKNIGEGLNGPQTQLWKEALFVQYYKKKTFSLSYAPIQIKSFPEGKKVLRSLIATVIKEGNFSDAC